MPEFPYRGIMNRHTVVVCLCLPIIVQSRPGLAQNACNRPDAPPWLARTYDHVMHHDDLASYAIRELGPPTDCSGQVTATFDGNDFGSLRLEFDGGQVFQVDTFPPESSFVTLTDSTGLKDEDEVLETLRRYAAGIGLEIDWSDPVEEIDRDYRNVSFRDPDVGLNASTELVYDDVALISVGLRLAL